MTLVIAFVALALGAGAVAAQTLCPNGQVTVHSTDTALSDRVCLASDKAFALYETCEVSLSTPIAIHIRDHIANDCFGLFHCGQARIDVLSPDAIAAMRNPDGLFATIPLKQMFDSIVVHELTHALYDATPCPSESCIATAEYLAYALQIASLPDTTRAAVAAGIAEGREVQRESISGIMYLFAPDNFALNAWGHYSQVPDQCAHIRDILDGTTVFDQFAP
jgi:hypothetical protein